MTADNVNVGSSSTQAYGEAWYKDKRYTEDPSSTFDWYQNAPHSPLSASTFTTPANPSSSLAVAITLLVKACMVDDGYNEVVNINISSVVIEAMQKKYSNRPQLKYMKMDVRDMKAFSTSSFAAVIDKGTLDSLLCENNSKQKNATMMPEEVCRMVTVGVGGRTLLPFTIYTWKSHVAFAG